jgi:hypothetical protein
MGLIVGFILFMFVAFFIAMSGNQGGGQTGGGSFFSGGGVFGLSLNGTPARGIMMSVSMTGRRTSNNGQRYEIRSARVDIEADGIAPYEVNTDVYIPTNLVRDVLPGSTMELRIDRSNQSYVLVIGPDVGFAQRTVRTACGRVGVSVG